MSGRPVRVLHVDTAREWRGGQTQLLTLLRAAPAGVAVALPPDAPIREAVLAMGVPVYPVPFRGALRGARALRSVVEEVRPDVVAAHTSHAHGHAWRAARGVPLVVHRRVDFPPGRDPLTRAKYRAATRYVAVSRAVAAVLRQAGVPEARIAVVPDGVDPAPFSERAPRVGVRASLGVPVDAPLIGAVGALVPHKGHRVLIEAMAWIDAERKDVHCVIAGDGPLAGALRADIDRLGLGARTRLLGRRDDVPSLLGALDVFCHPSLEEGMGQAVVEAMLAGVPIVCSGAGGLPEVVSDHETGLLVRPGAGDALARALLATLRGAGRAKARAERARSVALERFSPDLMVEGTLRAYRDALA